MNDRQSRLLAAIIDQFIHTALPVGSKKLLICGNFAVSSATIRTEMGVLEDEGYLEQPHISAGRIPTAKGYRAFVKDFMEPSTAERKVRQRFDVLRERYFQRKDQEYAYEAVTLLAGMIPNVAFATVPHKPRVYYMGLANALREPEFHENPLLATGVVEILEKRLTDLLDRVEVDDHVRYYIGEEDLLPQLHSCSLMVTAYRLRGDDGATCPAGWFGRVGILGPLRMDYAYNTVALEMVADMLRRVHG